MSSQWQTTSAFAFRATAMAIILCIVAISIAPNHLSAMAFAPPFARECASHRRSHPHAPITCTSWNSNSRRLHSPDILQLAATKSDEDIEKEVSAMKAKQIRQELESYGISAKSFFEKGELVEALVKARKEGKTPVDVGASEDAASSDAGSSSSSSSSGGNRQERIQQEMEKCKQMKVGELKKELESYGYSTKSYFEKSEFVRAVAEARVDGPKKSAGTGGSRAREEPRDPSYRDVNVSKFSGGKGLLGGGVIDVKAR